jgi:hypothetical protein
MRIKINALLSYLFHLRWIFGDVKAFLYGKKCVLKGLKSLGFFTLAAFKNVRHILNNEKEIFIGGHFWCYFSVPGNTLLKTGRPNLVPVLR